MHYNIAEQNISNCDRNDRKLALAALLPCTLLSVQLVLLYSFGLLPYHSTIRFINIVICAAVLLYALPVILRRKPITIVLLYGMFIIIILLSIVIHPGVEAYLPLYAFDLFCRCLPAFLCLLAIRNMNCFVEEIKRQSILIFVAGLVYATFVLLGNAIDISYNMAFSYYLLIPSCVFLYNSRTTNKALYIFASIFCIILMMILGSRGATVCYMAMLLLLIIQNKENRVKKIVLLLLLFLALAVFFIYAVDWLSAFLQEIGYSSRTLSLINNGTFLTHDSGRNIIYTNIINAITEKPFLGYGIGGDRGIVGGYVHNIFLELFCHYGIFIGLFIELCGIILLFIAYIRSTDKRFTVTIISIGIIPMMVSGTYLTEVFFWLCLGYCVNIAAER